MNLEAAAFPDAAPGHLVRCADRRGDPPLAARRAGRLDARSRKRESPQEPSPFADELSRRGGAPVSLRLGAPGDAARALAQGRASGEGWPRPGSSRSTTSATSACSSKTCSCSRASRYARPASGEEALHLLEREALRRRRHRPRDARAVGGGAGRAREGARARPGRDRRDQRRRRAHRRRRDAARRQRLPAEAARSHAARALARRHPAAQAAAPGARVADGREPRVPRRSSRSTSATLALFSTLAIEPLADRIVEGLCLETRAQGGVAWVARADDAGRLRLAAARGLVRVEREPEEIALDALPAGLEALRKPEAAPFAVESRRRIRARRAARATRAACSASCA